MSYSEDIKQIAYKLDPECWASYSGKPREYKSAMEPRRISSLQRAEKLAEKQERENPSMNTTDRLTMITESTFDNQMRRSMGRLEEMLHRGDKEVAFEIHEALHLLSRVVSLEREVKMYQEMLYRTFKGYSDHYNMEVNRNTMMQVDFNSLPVDKKSTATTTSG